MTCACARSRRDLPATSFPLIDRMIRRPSDRNYQERRDPKQTADPAELRLRSPDRDCCPSANLPRQIGLYPVLLRGNLTQRDPECLFSLNVCSPAAWLVAQRSHGAEAAGKLRGCVRIERLQRWSQNAAIAAGGGERRFEARNAACLGELIELGELLLGGTGFEQLVGPAEIEEPAHKPWRDGGERSKRRASPDGGR